MIPSPADVLRWQAIVDGQHRAGEGWPTEGFVVGGLEGQSKSPLAPDCSVEDSRGGYLRIPEET